MNTFKKHLATMPHGRVVPVNHGLVEIRDDGWVIVNGEETPIEDFGMYYYRDEPFPPTDSQELFDIFMDLLREQEGA